MLRKISLLALLFVCSLSYAETASEDDVKAAFIYHFINFTQWDDHQSAYYVCIPQDKTLRDSAQNLFRDKTINHRKIVVTDQQDSCHVLVSNDLPYTSSALTIGPLSKGALIEFRETNNKLKFAVNMDKVKNSKLKISSQLLKLAIVD
jgi:hypothetical protein